MSAQLLEVHLTKKVSQKVDYNWVSVTLSGLQRPIVIVITYYHLVVICTITDQCAQHRLKKENGEIQN